MKKRVLMGLVLLIIIVTSAVFAQQGLSKSDIANLENAEKFFKAGSKIFAMSNSSAMLEVSNALGRVAGILGRYNAVKDIYENVKDVAELSKWFLHYSWADSEKDKARYGRELNRKMLDFLPKLAGIASPFYGILTDNLIVGVKQALSTIEENRAEIYIANEISNTSRGWVWEALHPNVTNTGDVRWKYWNLARKIVANGGDTGQVFDLICDLEAIELLRGGPQSNAPLTAAAIKRGRIKNWPSPDKWL